MMQQREKILKKIQELKSKRNVVSERRKSESKKRKGINEPYNSKSCKRKCTKSVVSEPDHFADHKFSKGETVAIAYSDGWYPGQVEEVLDNTFDTVKCPFNQDTLHTKFILYFQKYLDLYSEYFDEIESTSDIFHVSGGGREPPTMGKQLVNFITCGCKSSAPCFVIYKAGREPTTYTVNILMK
jgi:hypothetical protein